METFTEKIGLLEGKSNWDTWKFKAKCLLRTVPKALEVVEGTFQKPTPPAAGAGDAAVSAYNNDEAMFAKADANALLILTTNMHEETLRKVIRFAREVWLDLNYIDFLMGLMKIRHTICVWTFSVSKKTPLTM